MEKKLEEGVLENYEGVTPLAEQQRLTPKNGFVYISCHGTVPLFDIRENTVGLLCLLTLSVIFQVFVCASFLKTPKNMGHFFLTVPG